MSKKICFRCKKEKEVSEFYRDKKNKDGYTASCKICKQSTSAAYQNKPVKNKPLKAIKIKEDKKAIDKNLLLDIKNKQEKIMELQNEIFDLKDEIKNLEDNIVNIVHRIIDKIKSELTPILENNFETGDIELLKNESRKALMKAIYLNLKNYE